jgi:(p)ppGpp synthase/HD superfamily hydrolase
VNGRHRLSNVAASLPKTAAALDFAELHHAGQRRNTDGAPFIEHPLEVGWLLYRAGAPDRVIAAGLLHDVLEKTDASYADVQRRFGSRIARLVYAVTEDDSVTGYVQRKAALRQRVAAAGPEALLVLAADKVSKVRELRSAIATASRRAVPVDERLFPPRRLAHFRHCLGLLEERLGEATLVRRLRTELGGLGRDLERRGMTRAIRTGALPAR